MRLFVGDDWAEDHHDVEVMDEAGRVLAKRRLPEGVAGITQLHALIGRYLPEDAEDAEVVSRDRDRPGPVGGGADRGRVHGVPGEPAAGVPVPGTARRVGRQERRRGRAHAGGHGAHRLPPAAPGCRRPPGGQGIKVVARTHKTLIWERTRAVQRLRHQLREYFPAALEAFEDLDAPDAARTAGQGAGPGPGGEADPRPDRRGAQARPPPGHRGQDRRDPGRAARRAPRPAGRADRRLRRHRPVPDRGDHHPQRAGQDPGRAGEGAFWPAPGR